MKVADKKEEKKKKRRIKGDAFWKLKGFEKRVKKFQENLDEWRNEKAEELELYPDLINWATGAIFNDGADIVEGKVMNAKVVGRLDYSVLKEYRKQLEEIKKIDNDMSEFRDSLAKHLDIWPDMIDLKTGVIKDEDDYDGFDPDSDEEEKEEIVKEENEE